MRLFCLFKTAFYENSKKRYYYLLYSACFLVMSAICFSWILFSGKSLIWRGDGFQQHFKALVYYSQYLRQIFIRVVAEHRFDVPDWDFYIGEGSDVLNTLHYYVIGDPIAFLSVFIPTRFMQYFYTFSCFLRIYLAGISFSVLCFGTGHKNRFAILSGTIAYCFCKWVLISAGTHPYFLNPLIYFPLMILGVEKIVRSKKPFLFIIITAISAISNLYFFYMIAILTAIYAIIRIVILLEGDLKRTALVIITIGVYAVIGVCMAGIVVVPVVMMLLGDSRLAYTQPFHWFYPLEYYSKLPSSILYSSQFELHIAVTAPALLPTFLILLRKKKDLILRVLVIVECIMILFPIFGRVLNGFSYMTNRWSFAAPLLLTFILVEKWDEIITLSKGDWTKLGLLCLAYYIICLVFDKSRTTAAFSAITLMSITLISLGSYFDEKKRFSKELILIVMVVTGCITNSFWYFSHAGSNFASETKKNSKVWEEWNDNELSYLDSDEETFTRISGTWLTRNANILKKISSVSLQVICPSTLKRRYFLSSGHLERIA